MALPVKYNLRPYYISSVILAVLVSAASSAGIFFSSSVFPTEVLLKSFMANDVINLFMIVPLLAAAMILTSKGKLIGLLFWPGVTMMIIYQYTAVVFGTPLSWFSLLYFTILILSIYIGIGLILSIISIDIKSRLAGLVHEKLSGWILIIFGAFILVSFYFVFAGPLSKGTGIPVADYSTAIADFYLCPAWLICGILLIRKKAFGYVCAAGLMFKACMLFIGLLFFFIINPIITDAPFAAADFIIISIMTVVFNIPFVLYLRGIIKSG